MEENIILALITATGAAIAVIFNSKFNTKIAKLSTEVESLKERTETLEAEKIENRNTITELRLKIEKITESYDKRIKELHDKLYKALQPKNKGGVF